MSYSLTIHDLDTIIWNSYGSHQSKPIMLNGFNVAELYTLDKVGNLDKINWLRVTDPRIHFYHTPVIFHWESGVNSWSSKYSYFFHQDSDSNYFIVPHPVFAEWIRTKLESIFNEVKKTHYYDQVSIKPGSLEEVLKRVAREVGSQHVTYITGSVGSSNIYSEAKLFLSRLSDRSMGETIDDLGDSVSDKVNEIGSSISKMARDRWGSFERKYGLSEDMDDFLKLFK